MGDREITQSKIKHTINYVESLMHKLTDDELDELIDELVHLYAEKVYGHHCVIGHKHYNAHISVLTRLLTHPIPHPSTYALTIQRIL